MTDSIVEKIDVVQSLPNKKKRERLKYVYCFMALFMAGVAISGLLFGIFNHKIFTECFVIGSIVYLVYDWYYKHNIARSLDPQTKI